MKAARARELKKTYATGAILLPATRSVVPGDIETKMLQMADDIQELLGALDALAAGKVDAFILWRDQWGGFEGRGNLKPYRLPHELR